MAIYGNAERLTLTFGALADPTRRAILLSLASGEKDVTELMQPFRLSQPTISKHLGVLERAGLVVCKQDAQRRPRALISKPLEEIDTWMDPFRQRWEERLSSLDAYLSTLKSKRASGSRRSKAKR